MKTTKTIPKAPHNARSASVSLKRGKLSFVDIKRHFDALNRDASHFVNSNDICTPMDCVKEMVDKIPAEFWKREKIKVLDSCCGNWNFHWYIQTKTELKNLHFNEINKRRIANIKKYFGAEINITIKDFLTFSESDKYNLVVSNPPYAKFNGNSRASKNHNLARAFIKKALDITEDGGYILFIVPNNWMSLSDRNILPRELTKYQFLHINIHWAKKRFPWVWSSFTWFLLRKVPNQKPFAVENNYVLKSIRKVKIGVGQEFIPLHLSREVIGIINKTINIKNFPKYGIQTTSDLHRTTKKEFISDEKSAEFKYRLIHTPTQTVRSKKKHKFQDWRKVFISLTNQYDTFIDNCGMTQSIAFIRCESRQRAEQIKRELDSDVFRFLNNITRYWNFNNIRVLQRFPLLEHVSLSKAESSFIYRFNKTYYG